MFIEAVLKPFETKPLTIRRTASGQPSQLVCATVVDGSKSGVISLSVPTGGSAAVDSTTGSLVSVANQGVNCSLEYYTPAPGTNESHGWGKTDDCRCFK